MKSLHQFIKEKVASGKVINAEESPLYKKRDKPEEKLSSEEEVQKALNTDATSRRIIAKNIQHPVGTRIGARLNLNVLKNNGIPVLTIHKGSKRGGSYGGEAQAYHHVVTLHNVEFNVNQSARDAIATGRENKSAMASVDGEIQDPSKHSFNGVVAKFNPKRQHVFVDENGRAIKSAEDVTLHGNRAYLRGKIEYHNAETIPHPIGDSPSDAKLHEKRNLGETNMSKLKEIIHQYVVEALEEILDEGVEREARLQNSVLNDPTNQDKRDALERAVTKNVRRKVRAMRKRLFVPKPDDKYDD